MKNRPHPNLFPIARPSLAQRPGKFRILHHAFRNAFTLLELLVSMSVLTMLIVFVAQLVGSASAVTTGSRKHMDADTEARLVFDRMAADFAKMVRRTDVDYVFYKNQAAGSGINDAVFFYSEAPAYYSGSPNVTSKSTGALIGYRINPIDPVTKNTSPHLERLGKGLLWDTKTTVGTSGAPGGMLFLSYLTNGIIPDPNSSIAGDGTSKGNWGGTSGLGTLTGTSNCSFGDGADSDYIVLGDSVFRLEIAFLLKDGTFSNKPITNPTIGTPSAINGSGVGSRMYDTNAGIGYVCTSATVNSGTVTNAVWNRIGIQDVSAVVVAIAILDNNSRKIVTNFTKLTTAFPDPTDTELVPVSSSTVPTLMAKKWLDTLNKSGFAATAGIPQAAASQVRIYQRTFYLNN